MITTKSMWKKARLSKMNKISAVVALARKDRPTQILICQKLLKGCWKAWDK